MGVTPLHEAIVPAGSWVIELHHAERPVVRLPILLSRGERVVFERPVPLLTEEELGGDEWVHVPEGPWLRGGDPSVSYPRPGERVWGGGFLVRRHATTAAEYAEFLAHLAAKGEDWSARAPRLLTGGRQEAWVMWPGDPPFSFPLTDVHGDEWPGDYPIMGVSHHDARAYAAWRGARLLLDDEYEQAARGADGRAFVWGDEWDGAACKCAETRLGRPLPEPVGAVPTDRSVYGVCDLAGSMRTWCDVPANRTHEVLRLVRGGQWSGFERLARTCNRYYVEPEAVQTFLGVRLARSLEADDGQ